MQQIPHTSKTARVTAYQAVNEVFAIEVKNASYRGAKFNGVIELVNGTDSIRKYKGTDRANAKLTWFGKTLKKHSPFINLCGAEITLLPSYTGKVIACLG